jgi:NADP-dependent 3-hydroxy acid dehydrogenase YdfG
MRLDHLETKGQQLNLFASENKGLILIGPGEHFGLHIAERFGREGFDVGLIARSENKLSEMVGTLQKSGISACYACADVRNIQQLNDAFKCLETKLKKPQCLIYNVKNSIKGNGLKLNSAELTETFDANVSGAISTIQISLPILKKTIDPMQNSSFKPTIILTGGGYKDTPDENKLSLSIGKAGIHTVFTTLKRLLFAQGVTLKTIVIEGVVRENGSSLRSEDVAEQFWKIFTSPSNKLYFQYPEKVHKEHNPDQLNLPI